MKKLTKKFNLGNGNLRVETKGKIYNYSISNEIDRLIKNSESIYLFIVNDMLTVIYDEKKVYPVLVTEDGYYQLTTDQEKNSQFLHYLFKHAKED